MGEWLWDIVPWGYQFLLLVEGMRTAFFDVFFSMVTDIGSGFGYIVLLIVVYWCVDKSVGQGLSFAYLYTAALNTWIKDIWRIPRPGDPALEGVLDRAGIVRRVSPLRHEDSPSFVSGHTQGATVAWGYMAARFKRAWFWIVAVATVVLIGLSRMYLGVHFPQDVIGGLFVGGTYLALWLAAAPRVWEWLSRLSVVWLYALALLVPVIVLLARPLYDMTVPMGAAIGLGIGYLLEGRTIRFSTDGPWLKRLLRAVLGLVIVLVTYLGLSALFDLATPLIGQAAASALRALRYALVGFAGGWLAPWAFVRVKLADRAPEM